MKRIVAILVFAVFILSGSGQAQGPLLPVQGNLRSAAGEVVDGTLSVTFALYDVSQGGDALYSTTKEVVFQNGRFVTYLGDSGDAALEAADFDGLPSLWLGVTVSTDEEMSPRIRLGSSPFSVYAQICGHAESATTANDLSCSGCIDGGELGASARTLFATNEHGHSGEDVSLNIVTSRQVLSSDDTDDCDQVQAKFCALTTWTAREVADVNNRLLCRVTNPSPGLWEVCANSTPGTSVECRMTCFQ